MTKNSNIVPIHKKESENLIKNYRLISLLPILTKILEKFIFNLIFNHFMQNKFFTECQSGLTPGVLCFPQLLCITYEIYKSSGCNPPVDTRQTFLDISKAFDNVWYVGFNFQTAVL